MTAHDPRVTLTEVLAAHAWRPMMHSQTCSCGWHASLPHPDLHRAHLAERIEEHIAARLAPIRALADEWERNYSHMLIAGFSGRSIGADSAAKRLRAALDAPVSASQDHDGAEGQGEGERAGEGDVSRLVHNHPPYRPICAERFAGNHIRGACLNDDGSPR